MTTTRVHIDPGFGVGEVNRRIFGTFVEHMGRCVYTGIYEPGHPTADEHGFRTDVAALVRELGATAVRYPGGNFVSNYRWEDGVGPLGQRPRNLDFARRSVETNEVGTNEFLSWCSGVGLEPVMAVNLGTRGLAEAMDRYIGHVVATADHVAAHHHSEKKVKVSFDEWNVWAQHRFAGENAIEVEHAPRLIEDAYTVTDAVVVGGLLITLLRHTDRVGLACQAQLVNVIAPIRTEPGGPAWRQTIFHPFALTARHARGRVLDLRTEGALIDTPAYGPVSQVWPVATWDEESGDLAIFLINRSLRAATAVALDLSRFGDLALVEHLVITDSGPDAVNSMAEPDRVVPRPGASRLDSRELSIEAPALSWHCLRLHRS